MEEDKKVAAEQPAVEEVKPEVRDEEKKSDAQPAEKPVTRAPDEDDERFNLRQQLKVAKLAMDSASSAEEKSFFKQQMASLRRGLYEHDTEMKSALKEAVKLDDVKASLEEDEASVKAGLTKLGYVPKEEILKEAEKLIEARIGREQADKNVVEHSVVIDKFYATRTDIRDSEDKSGFEAWVIKNFNITPATPPKQLALYLEMAANTFFPNKQNKSASAREAQDKVDVMNISSNQGDSQSGVKVPNEERAYLRSKGWSDEKIDRFYS